MPVPWFALTSRTRWKRSLPKSRDSGSAAARGNLYFREPQTEADGQLLAGDTAGFIDPFAGDGISLALQSGTLAAESLAPFLRGDYGLEQVHQRYRAAYQQRFNPAFRNAARLRNAITAPKWLRSTVLTFAGIPGVGKLLVRGTRAR